MQVEQYVPKRDYLGRFKKLGNRKFYLKIIALQFVLLNLLTTAWIAKEHYNFYCEGIYGVVTEEKCHEIVVNKFEAREAYRLESENSRLMAEKYQLTIGE